MKIRKARKGDLKNINKLFRKEYSKYPYNEKWKEDVSLQKLKKYFKNNLMFVLENNTEIIGFIIGHVDLWDRGKTGFIDEVVIDSNFQDRGYGKKLMNFLEKKFKGLGAKNIDLITNPKSKAFKIYKKEGFSTLKDFTYMTKKLK